MSGTSGARRWPRPAWRAVLALSALTGLWVLLQRPVAAALTLLALAGATQLAVTAPERLERAVHRVGHGLAQVVGWFLLTLVAVVVILPAWLVLRLLGLDPLHTRSTGWHARRQQTERPRRPFALDRSMTGPTPARSWRTTVALLAVGALLAVAVLRIVDRPGTEEEVPTALRGATYDAFDAPALAGLEWTDQASAEFGALSAGITYTSYVANSVPDHRGRYVNVTDRVRRSYEPTPVPGQEPLEVWFFGGSTMFGFSAQRDDHTIPSEVVRLAEADGISVHARNYGSPGYVNFQETILLAELLSSGRTPDLVVFYDGINDTAVLIQQVFGGIGTPGDPADITAFATRRALAGVLNGSAAPPVPLAPTAAVGRPPTVDDVVNGVWRVHDQGRRLALDLAAARGFPVRHFWQPDLFNKDALAPGEEVVVERLGMDDLQYRATAAVSRAVLAALPDGVIDLTDAWAGTDEAVLTDQAHTNELGARLVAEAMYEQLRTDLTRLAAEG